MPAETIDHATLVRLVEAHAIQGAHVFGQPGGWGLLVRHGSAERRLAAARGGRVRVFRKLDTLVGYLKDLGISRFEVDAASFDPRAASAYTRPGASEPLRHAHAAAAYDRWFREQVAQGLKEADDPTTQWISNETRRTRARNVALPGASALPPALRAVTAVSAPASQVFVMTNTAPLSEPKRLFTGARLGIEHQLPGVDCSLLVESSIASKPLFSPPEPFKDSRSSWQTNPARNIKRRSRLHSPGQGTRPASVRHDEHLAVVAASCSPSRTLTDPSPGKVALETSRCPAPNRGSFCAVPGRHEAKPASMATTGALRRDTAQPCRRPLRFAFSARSSATRCFTAA